MRALAVVVLAWLLSSVQMSVGAQEVFVTRGAGGNPAFSDKAPPGATPVTLPPLNVIEPIPVVRGVPAISAPNERGNPAPAAPAYHRFRISFPEDEGSVVANTAVFEVRVAPEPPLQLGAGHAITVSINGRPVGQRFTATEFMIPPEFWGDALPPANQRYQLDAAIVDRDGRVLERARPVTFYLRQVAGVFRRPPPSAATAAAGSAAAAARAEQPGSGEAAGGADREESAGEAAPATGASRSLTRHRVRLSLGPVSCWPVSTSESLAAGAGYVHR